MSGYSGTRISEVLVVEDLLYLRTQERFFDSSARAWSNSLLVTRGCPRVQWRHKPTIYQSTKTLPSADDVSSKTACQFQSSSLPSGASNRISEHRRSTIREAARLAMCNAQGALCILHVHEAWCQLLRNHCVQTACLRSIGGCKDRRAIPG